MFLSLQKQEMLERERRRCAEEEARQQHKRKH
jgi:hypothetical protein